MSMTIGRFLPGLAVMWVGANMAGGAETAKHFEGPYHITVTSSTTVRATVKSMRQYPNLAAQEWLAVFPLPPEFEGQPSARGRVEIVGAPFADFERITDEGILRQPLVAVHWSPDQIEGMQTVAARAIYEVTVARRVLEPGEPARPVRPLSPSERSAFLAPTPHCDYLSRPFQAWLRKTGLSRGSHERDLDFAHRAMTTLVTTHTYRYDPTSDRSASAVCVAGWSDCGGLSTIYTSILRANGIPARCLAGRHLKLNRTHVRMDFYSEEVGWVPADPSVSIASHSVDAGFGREGSDMVIMHLDRIRFRGRDQCNLGGGLVFPQKAQGSGAGMTLEHTMVVEDLSADGGPAPDASRPAGMQKRKSAPSRRRR
jgi:transglutaminase-like putative cysteine protease